MASVALVMTGVVCGAQGAQAAASPADLTMPFYCVTWTQSNSSAVTVTGAVGDTFTAMKASNCGTIYIVDSAGIVDTTSEEIGYPTPSSFTIVGSGTFILDGFFDLTITVVATPSATSSSGAGPADLFQSISLGSVPSCASVSRPDLDWGGVASGNWTQSWAMWPNAGKGGPVCNRVLWFDSNSSRWSSALR
jgi:hypothetical protein